MTAVERPKPLRGDRPNGGHIEIVSHLCRSPAHDLKLSWSKDLRRYTANRHIAWLVAQCHRYLVPAKEGRCSGQYDEAPLRLREREVCRPDAKRQTDCNPVDDIDGRVHLRTMYEPGRANQLCCRQEAQAKADAKDSAPIGESHWANGEANKQQQAKRQDA